MSSKALVQFEGHDRLVDQFVDDPEKMILKAGLINLCKRVSAVLDRHYPGWLWAIRPDERGGIIDIFSVRIDAEWGYTLHTERLHADVNLDSVMHAAGEILERYCMPRGPYTYEAWKAGNWFMGKLVPKLTDKERGAQRALHARNIRHGLETGQVRIIVEHGSSSVGDAIKAAGRK